MASQAQLAQYALNIAVPLQSGLLNGQVEPAARGNLMAVCGALIALAEAVINSGGGTVSNSLVSGKYSTSQSTTAPIFT